MKLEEVLAELKKGEKIRRSSWGGKRSITLGSNGYLCDQCNFTFEFTFDDFLADDWGVVKKTKKIKLKDMTWKERTKRKEKNCSDMICPKCVFRNVNCSLTGWFDNKELYSDKFLDQEIDIMSEEEYEDEI